MSEIDTAKKERRGYYTHVRDGNLNWAKRGLNARVAMIVVGDDDDASAPHAGVIWVNGGPGDPLRGRHLHPRDAINLVIEGAMYMDGRWLRPGQAKIVPANVKYGDSVAAADGLIFLEIFADRQGAAPVFDDPAHQAYFDEVHSSALFED